MNAELVGSRPLNLHAGGPAPQWCLQCGETGKPERAIGVDVDGEPACNLHRVKVGGIFDRGTKVEPAATSPLQATEQEKADMDEKVCRGFERECSEKLGPHNTTGLCGRCYARKHYHDRKAKLGRGVAKPHKSAKAAHARIDRLTDHVNREIGVAQETPLHQRIAVDPTVDLGVPPDTSITVTLPAWKLSRLLAALL